MIPDADERDNPDPYHPRWDAIKETVNTLGSTLATPLTLSGDTVERWREVTYTALKNAEVQLAKYCRSSALLFLFLSSPAL